MRFIKTAPITKQTCWSNHLGLNAILQQTTVIAKALWNHITLDPVELEFHAGDTIQVVDMLDKDCWWGKLGDHEGWFPAAFVAIKADEHVAKPDVKPGSNDVSNIIKTEAPLAQSDNMRAKIIRELISSERDYVKHLGDVIEGYLMRATTRPEMFNAEELSIIFGNIKEIYAFACSFLGDLEKAYQANQPHESEIGNCFIKHQRGFEIYSDYCNNHAQACRELQRFKSDVKYRQFFEACRLLQGMVNIPLEGFLLTPIQKICKYPLQLKELARHTEFCHADYGQLQAALDATRWTATFINERKRKFDSLETLLSWQDTVADWQGPTLVEASSELIFAGQMLKVNEAGWSRDRIVYLFDHQLIYCKKDLLWKDMLYYRGRINMDMCVILRVKNDSGISMRYGFKLYDHVISRWHLFVCNNVVEYDCWLRAFDDERRRVTEDRLSGFDVGAYCNKALLSHKLLLDSCVGGSLQQTKDKTHRQHSMPITTLDQVASRLSRSLSMSANRTSSSDKDKDSESKKPTAAASFTFGTHRPQSRDIT